MSGRHERDEDATPMLGAVLLIAGAVFCVGVVLLALWTLGQVWG